MGSHPELLGRIAVHFKLISMEQLVAATQEQSRHGHKKLGEILVARGHISEAQLAKLLKAQRQYVDGQQRKAQACAAADATLEIEPTAHELPADSAAGEEEKETLDLDPFEEPKPVPEPEPDPRAVTWLQGTLTRAAQMHASDVLIHSDAKLRLRRFGRLVEQGDGEIGRDTAAAVLMAALSPQQRAQLDDAGEVDFALTLPEVGRFRVNIYRQHRGLSGAFHFLPLVLPSLADLGLPSTLARLTNFHQGLVLVTGPAGCGKTSTLAALINIINEERADHILTIEDPIEYIHSSKRCVVNQREVGRHTESFPRALRAALREDPDIICIGELRDLETISLALSAAETGHLVLATLHTSSAIRTINRIVGAYPPGQQGQIRSMLSESLHAIISQRLVPTADNNGVALALEILHITRAVANLIREDRTFQIQSVLQTGRAHGMVMLDQSLKDLLTAGRITREVATARANDPKLFA